jgi:hypothetical protein
VGAILAGADQCHEFAAMAPVDNHRYGKPIMPKAEDYRPAVLRSCQARMVVPSAPKGGGHEPFDQEEGPRDESLRAAGCMGNNRASVALGHGAFQRWSDQAVPDLGIELRFDPPWQVDS